jgi:hypothetical protein
MAALDAALGLVLLAGYILGVVSLAAAITYAVIRIFPTERNPKKAEKPDKPGKQEPPAAKNGEAGAGSLFRRSKRGKT